MAILSLTFAVVGQLAGIAEAAATEADQGEKQLFAVVNGTEISLQRYVDVLRGSSRTTFYHGTPPEEDLEAFRYDIGQRLIQGALLLQEAERRGVPPDEAWVKGRVSALSARYGDQPEWKDEGPDLMAKLEQQLSDQSRVNGLEDMIRDVPPPSDEELAVFYEANREKFTAPDRVRASIILLRVEPSANTATWAAAEEEAARLEKKVREGADFAELARLHSQDPSAEDGGDLGYMHRGMIGSIAQVALDSLEIGEISQPVQLLEGIAILRLDERIEGQVSPLETVKDRATALWLREEQERARNRLIESLVAQAEIEIRDPEYIVLEKKLTMKKRTVAASGVKVEGKITEPSGAH
jgi:hypothetical protein